MCFQLKEVKEVNVPVPKELSLCIHIILCIFCSFYPVKSNSSAGGSNSYLNNHFKKKLSWVSSFLTLLGFFWNEECLLRWYPGSAGYEVLTAVDLRTRRTFRKLSSPLSHPKDVVHRWTPNPPKPCPADLRKWGFCRAHPGPSRGAYFQSVVHFGHWFESLFLSEFPAGYQPTARFVLSAHPSAIWVVLNSPVDDRSIRQRVLIKMHA